MPATQRRRLPPEAASMSLLARKRWDPLNTGYAKHCGKAQLSGKCYVVVHPFHLSASVLCEKGKATFALCGKAIRGCARPGDVIVVVSPTASHKRTRNISTTQRLIVVEGSLEPWVYHSLAAPVWARDRSDRIYTCRLASGGGWRPTPKLLALRGRSLTRTGFETRGPPSR